MKFSDADNLAYLRAQSLIIEKEAVELDYNSQYSELIPVSTQGNPFAAAVVFASSTKVGRAGWINGNADDLPRADLDMKESVKPVHTAAIGYGYGFEELGIAQAMGINLAADKAIAARRSYEEFVDVIAFNGDSTKTIKGLTNLGSGSYKAKTDATSANWSDADKLMAMLTAKLLETGSGNKPTADTILLPTAMYSLLATKFLANGVSYLDQMQNASVITGITGKAITIRAVSGLDTAASGSKNRVILYKRDPSVVQLYIPMPHRFLPVYQDGPLRYEVPGVFRIAGVNVKRPDDVMYLDYTGS